VRYPQPRGLVGRLTTVFRRDRSILPTTGVDQHAVLACLRGDTVAHEQEILAVLAQLQVLIVERRVRRRFEGLEPYLRRLPRIVYLARQGTAPDAIAPLLSEQATPYGVETALELLARSVAEQLGRPA
jgi:hypothetical protein